MLLNKVAAICEASLWHFVFCIFLSSSLPPVSHCPALTLALPCFVLLFPLRATLPRERRGPALLLPNQHTPALWQDCSRSCAAINKGF